MCESKNTFDRAENVCVSVCVQHKKSIGHTQIVCRRRDAAANDMFARISEYSARRACAVCMYNISTNAQI